MGSVDELENEEGQDGGAAITFKEVRKWLWESREREISHMWQRGAFLATFVIGWFTFYIKMIVQGCRTSVICNWMGIATCVTGIVLALLWIAMAKGSSAWYSIYEQAIGDLVKEYFKDRTQDDELFVGIIGEKCPIVKGCSHDNKWSNSYISGNGGTYSLPRINIAIGHLLFLIWATAFLGHCVMIMLILCPSCVDFIRQYVAWGTIVVFVCCYFVFWLYSKYSSKFLRSKSLEGYDSKCKDADYTRKTINVRMAFIRISKPFRASPEVTVS